MTLTNKRTALVNAPMAITSAGDVLLNLAHLGASAAVLQAVEKLVPKGSQVFVGVVVPQAERAGLARDIEDAASELACRVGGRLVRRSR